ncbi:N-acetyldiaminopimelate deacetylase [Secundilactobacillus oryzae JCM 18671]|uniref:N-acetyldiaminopimelate deacetylase n=1 Tax=Secundilactobacillus oryzae JCM 18671 TaxID=1291743 RepID=A0A081BIX1_9LACO|nr:N-acetyldiaminopimelate deacetylase [Secundilactobacillus oryzae JCM 18671]
MLTETDLITIRRELHQHPELALHETETHERLLTIIADFNQTHLQVRTLPELPTAILIRVTGSAPQRTIGYRTDIDALPVTEATGLAYASQNPGIMHACGHDVHMAVALGVLSYFAEHQPQDNLIFFFQPAEESENGGKLAYEMNAFEADWRPDEFYGLHDNPDLPAGAIGCRMGTLFAGTTEVNVDFTGKGGHAAYPQDANDMVVAAAAFISQIQTIVSRNVDPIEGGVITLGKLEAGTIRNVIAETAHIEGTIRGLTQTMIEHIDDRIRDVAAGIARSFNAEVTVSLNQGGYLPVENDPALTANFINYMKENESIEFIETAPAMTGEDFGYLLSKIPGTMFWLGVGDDAQLHSATLTPDESAIQAGVDAITGFMTYRMLH